MLFKHNWTRTSTWLNPLNAPFQRTLCFKKRKKQQLWISDVDVSSAHKSCRCLAMRGLLTLKHHQLIMATVAVCTPSWFISGEELSYRVRYPHAGLWSVAIYAWKQRCCWWAVPKRRRVVCYLTEYVGNYQHLLLAEKV